VQHDEKLAREQLKVTGVPFFVFDQRIALAGAQPCDVFIQVFDQVLKTQQETSINQPEDGVVCTDENCEIPDQK